MTKIRKGKIGHYLKTESKDTYILGTSIYNFQYVKRKVKILNNIKDTKFVWIAIPI